MQIYTGGQVSAKVVLDTKEFDSAIERVAQRMKDFESSLNSAGATNFSDKIVNLEKRLKAAETTITNLKSRIDDYKTKLNDLRNGHKQTEDSFKAVTTQSKQYEEQLKRLATSLKDYRVNTAEANQASAQYKSSLMGLSKALKTYNAETNRFKTESQQGIRTMSLWATENEKVTNSFEKQQKFLNYIHTGYNKITGAMVKTTEVLKTFNFALLDGIDKETVFYRRTVQLASAMQRINSQGTANWAGRGQFGYSQYVSQISKLNEAMTRQKQIESSIKAQKLDQYYAKVGSASAKYWNQIRQGTINLNTYKSQMNQINSILNQQTSRTQKLASAQHRLFQQYHTTNLNTYKANMNKINEVLARQTKEHTANDVAVRQSGRGLTSFNNGVVQTAHSGRILSNTLYQIRGALLSLKMIFTAMGGMALWGFAASIAEGVKETLTAKNEMEAQLRQNNKVGEGGIAYFNKQLEETTKLFPKINKYSIGETVSSIGLEFNLNAKQMADSLDIVSMVQSEYVRAGRKEEEAALAVKDILQGEFSRLSRETGVGKEELIAYGWSGKKDDVESLMKALRKAAQDRHWDVFAAKATSLNDVMTILKSRFSETGADILNSATPLIVGAFNTIIGAIGKVQNAFNGLNSFWQNATLFGGALSGILAIGTALPMITKGMGLADIATIGWGKSLLTAALNLNKAEVAQYGFRKALAAVITGTQASELAHIRTSKAILGRVLGVKQATLAEHGFLSALVESKATLKGHTQVAASAAAGFGNLRQKIIYLAKGEIVADQASATWGKTLKSLITSTRLLKIAIAGLMAINVIVWLANIAAWCDTVKKSVDGFNDVAENGKQILKDAKSTVSNYETALSKLTKGTDEYAKAEANLTQARANRDDIVNARKLVKEYEKQNKETEESIKLRHQSALKDSYVLAGKDYKAATELASGYSEKVSLGQYYINKSWEEYDKRIYKASQHVNEHIGQLKAAGASTDEMVRYIDEYNLEAENAAELWKKFNQGDMASGAYAMLSELKLAWIDISHHPEVVKLIKNLGDTWKGFQPTLKAIVEDLKWLGLRLVDIGNWLMSNDMGKAVVTWGAFGVAIGGVALKIGKWISGSKSTIDMLKTIGSKLKDRITDWKNYGDEVEKANKKAGGGSTSTGGINGDIEGKGSGSLKTDLGNIAKNRAKSFANNALLIAEGMDLMTEAILLLNAPMLALAGTGALFKAVEPQVRSGIEGLKLIAPVVLALLAPTVALMIIMGRFHIETSTLLEGFKSAAVGVALGITLVTEAIVLLNAPLIGLAILGSVYGGVQDAAQQGIQAMQVVGDALKELVIWIPVFAAGIALAAITIGSGGVGGIAIVAAAAGIALGIGLVTEAIIALCIPLEAVAEIGANFPDLSNAQQGAEAMKVTSEALKYVEQGVASLVTVQWDILKSNLASLLGVDMGTALDDLVKDDGFLPKLSKFAEKFNGLEFTPINQDKATALANTATGITAVNDAMKAVKTAMENLPEEFKKGGNGNPSISYDPKTDSTAIVGSATDTEGYFDTLIEPLKQLKDFIDKFNNSPELDFGEGIDTSKVAAIQTASDMIVQIKSAVDNVKQTMGMIADAGWEQNMASGGIGAAVSGWLVGLTPGGATAEGYSSSLGSSLKEMENVVKDIVTFNNNINTLVSGGNGDGNGTDSGGAVNAMANMVTAVDQAIQSLTTTLQNAVPTVKSSAQGIGTGIRDGIKTGIGDLTNITVQPLTTALNTAKAYGHTYGQGVGYQTTQGYKTGLKVKSATEDEINTTLTYLDGKKQDFYDKGAALGDALSRGYKEKGMEHFSPGRLARATFDELGYIEQAFDEAIMVIPSKAEELGASLAENYTPQLATDIGLTDMSTYEAGLAQIGLAAENTDMQTSMAFTNMNMTTATTMGSMTTTVNGAFTNIDQNATTSYGRIVNTTRTSLKNMQDQTTKNIGAIRTSWRGMQTALIASAEQIRSETSAKIHQLESNMASFWNKIQNPANLLAAGNSMIGGHTRRQSRPTGISSHKGGRRLLAAGNPALGQRVTGISDKFRSIGSDSKIREKFAEYMQCLMNGGVCAAGGGSGWHFNWSKEIQDVFMQWHTHFGEIYDPYLRVGKFENDDFPVRGIAPIALKYIEDAIGRTSYEFYYDDRYSPLEAWNRGSFNCVDGARLAIAFADAFGFGGGEIRYTTWDGIGHAYAYIPGLGVIDATAIQGDYGLTASKVSYSAGSHTIPQSRPPQTTQNSGITINIGDIIVRIEGDVENAEEKGKQIGDEINNRIYNMLRRSPSTGQ